MKTTIREIFRNSLVGKTIKVRPFVDRPLSDVSDHVIKTLTEKNIVIDGNYIIGVVEDVNLYEEDYESDYKSIQINGYQIWVEYETEFEIID